MKTVLIGGVLTILSFLIVPTFLVVGYLLRVLRATMRGDEMPPVFDDWGEMLVDGVKGFVIALVYFIIPTIIAAVFVGVGAAAASGGGNSGGLVGGLIGLVGLLVAFVLGLLAAYVVPAALANYAETDRMGAGFDFGALRPILLSGKYATGWVMAFAIILAAGLVNAVLNVIPFLGFIVGAFVSFYAVVAAYYIIGSTWGKVHTLEMRDEGDVAGERQVV